MIPSKIEWDLTNGPPKEVARAIRYSGSCWRFLGMMVECPICWEGGHWFGILMVLLAFFLVLPLTLVFQSYLLRFGPFG